jgi:hypothetical protein
MARTRSSSASTSRSRNIPEAAEAARAPASPAVVEVLLRAGEERLRPLLSALAGRKDELTPA